MTPNSAGVGGRVANVCFRAGVCFRGDVEAGAEFIAGDETTKASLRTNLPLTALEVGQEGLKRHDLLSHLPSLRCDPTSVSLGRGLQLPSNALETSTDTWISLP